MTSGSNLDVAALVGKIAPVLHDDLEQRFIDERPHPAGLAAMARSGLLGLSLPRRYGGLGGDYRALGRAAEALARIDLAYQIALTVHLALTAMTLLQWGGEAQRRRWLPALARGERIATFGLTEPGAGSDVAAVRMRAVRAGDEYRLSGEKSWISDANTADLFLLFATLDSSARHKGLAAFLVPRETPGVSTTVLHGKLGVRAGDTGTVVCDDAIVPADSRLGDEGEGFPIALSGLANGLFTVGYGALGGAGGIAAADGRAGPHPRPARARRRSQSTRSTRDREDGLGRSASAVAAGSSGRLKKPRFAQSAADEPGEMGSGR